MSRVKISKSLGWGGTGLTDMFAIVNSLVGSITEMLNADATQVTAEELTATADSKVWTLANDNVVRGSESFTESRPEEVSLIVTGAATGAGNVTVTLAGTAVTVAVLATDTIEGVATKIRGTTFTGWTTGGEGDVVTFVASSVGNKVGEPTVTAAATGVTATIETTQEGLSAAAIAAADIQFVEYAYANEVAVAKVWFVTPKVGPKATYQHVATMPENMPNIVD